MILLRGCNRAPQVKTYLKKNVIKPSSPNSSIPPSLMLKEKWRRWQVSSARSWFSDDRQCSASHTLGVLLGLLEAEHIISSPVVSDLYNLASAILFEMAFVRSIFSCIVERQQSLATSLEALRETNTSDCWRSLWRQGVLDRYPNYLGQVLLRRAS